VHEESAPITMENIRLKTNVRLKPKVIMKKVVAMSPEKLFEQIWAK
jgi:hypothetical protein